MGELETRSDRYAESPSTKMSQWAGYDGTCLNSSTQDAEVGGTQEGLRPAGATRRTCLKQSPYWVKKFVGFICSLASYLFLCVAFLLDTLNFAFGIKTDV